MPKMCRIRCILLPRLMEKGGKVQKVISHRLRGKNIDEEEKKERKERRRTLYLPKHEALKVSK